MPKPTVPQPFKEEQEPFYKTWSFWLISVGTLFIIAFVTLFQTGVIEKETNPKTETTERDTQYTEMLRSEFESPYGRGRTEVQKGLTLSKNSKPDEANVHFLNAQSFFTMAQSNLNKIASPTKLARVHTLLTQAVDTSLHAVNIFIKNNGNPSEIASGLSLIRNANALVDQAYEEMDKAGVTRDATHTFPY